MKLICSEKIEVIFNHYADETNLERVGIPVTYIERIVLVDGEEIYRDKQKPNIYNKDKSLLYQFKNWANEYYSETEQTQCCNNISSNRRNYIRFFSKLWFKLFRKRFKFKT